MKKRAVSLVEICIAVLIGSLIVFAITNFMTSSLKSSTKGSSHLTNIQNTAILMAQIETDLRRSSSIIFPPLDTEDQSLKLEVWDVPDSGGLATFAVIFAPEPRGIKRSLDFGSGPTKGHIFCSELAVESHFRQIRFPGGKIGVYAKLKGLTLPKKTEEFSLERLIFCQNNASNSPIPGWQN